ncbi:MAG: lipid IV(A) 3-deoxy-D-manno-octulosonic acid transferase [Steroidobacteraceae bacterium]|jgi:3-deoxy-D-manno-octulosonic-acid transferase|nr:lipid IV(A) 3-deoxy-D-manno-octulosonic acid transferase [Steroidobacteraceae bacterium]
MRYLYTLIAYLILAPAFCLVLWFRGLRDRRYWQDFDQRFGRGPTPEQPAIWVHAVSVGEVQAAAVLVRCLHERYAGVPIVVTTLTPTGAERARALLGERATVRYMPLDLPGSVRRFFDQVRPRLAVIFETELWPNLYHECGRRRVPLVLASARISPRSMSKYTRFITLYRQTLSHGHVIAAQGPDDAARFRKLGAKAERTHVTGNLKFDFALPPDVATKGHALREHYAPGRPVWVAGSTHGGEEDLVLEAHRLVRRAHPTALLVLVPRHPQRFGEVASWLEKEQVRFIRRSQPAARTPDIEVLLVDTLGELLDFYAMGDVAFVGGSLVTVGGHNLLEPAALGVPVLAGPHNFNSADIAKILEESGAAEIVHDAHELGNRVAALLSSPAERERIGNLGRASVEENRGALEKLIGLIDPLLVP